jgi:hypothetical protein
LLTDTAMALFDKFKKKKGEEEFLELSGTGFGGGPGGAMAEPAAAPELPGLPAPPTEPAFPMPSPMPAAPAAPPGGDMTSVMQRLDLISSKLDAIKAELSAVTQRLNNIEYGMRGEQPAARPATPGTGETGWRY